MFKRISVFILLAVVLITSVFPVSAADPDLETAAAISDPNVPIDVTRFEYVVYDMTTWDVVCSGTGNSFTYKFIAGRNYCIRFLSSKLSSSIVPFNSQVSWMFTDLYCSNSAYSLPKVNSALFYYDSTGKKVNDSIAALTSYRFNSLPTFRIPFDSSIKSSTFQMVTDFNYFKVDSTSSVTFRLNGCRYHISDSSSVFNFKNYMSTPFEDGIDSTFSCKFPSDLLYIDQYAYPTKRPLSFGDFNKQFSVSGNNFVDGQPDMFQWDSYSEYGYSFKFYPLGNNFFYIDSLSTGTKFNFSFKFNLQTSVPMWLSLLNTQHFTVSYYDIDGVLLKDQSFNITSDNLKILSDNTCWLMMGSLTLSVPNDSFYLKFSFTINDMTPYVFANGDWIKFSISDLTFSFSWMNAQGTFDDLESGTDSIFDSVVPGLDMAGDIFANVFQYLADYLPAILVAGNMFLMLSRHPFFQAVLYFSLSIGIFAFLLNIGSSIAGSSRAGSARSKGGNGKKGG